MRLDSGSERYLHCNPSLNLAGKGGSKAGISWCNGLGGGFGGTPGGSATPRGVSGVSLNH